jgi:hypothetical protein
MPVYAKRVDSTAKALRAELERCGACYAVVNGDFDGVAWVGPVLRCIDWKSPGGELTKQQQKLVAKGMPLVFVSTVDQVQALVAGMKKEAGI